MTVDCEWAGTMLARGDGPQVGNNGRTAFPNYATAGGAYVTPIPQMFVAGQTYSYSITIQHSVSGTAGTYAARFGLSGDPNETVNGSLPGILFIDGLPDGTGTVTGSFVAGLAAEYPQYVVVSLADGDHSGTNYARVTFSIRSSSWPACSTFGWNVPSLFGEVDRVTDPSTVPYVLRAVRDIHLSAGDSIKATVQMSHDVASTFDIVGTGLIAKTYFSIEKLGSLIIPAIGNVPSVVQSKFATIDNLTLDLTPAPGDTLIAWRATRNGPGSYVSTPNGWTKIADVYNNDGFVRGGAMFRRVVQAGDGRYFQFAGAEGTLTIMEWSGSYVGHVAANQVGPTTAITCGGEIASIGTPCVIVGCASIGNSDNDGPNPGVTPYSGVLEIVDDKSGQWSPGTWVGYRSIPEPQGSYTIGGTYGISNAFCGVTVLLTAG